MDANGREDKLAVVYTSLEKSKREEEKKNLQQLITLYTSADEEFEEQAKAYVEQAQKSNRRIAALNHSKAVNKIIEVWKDTRPHLDLDEYVFSVASSSKRNRNPYGQTSYSYLVTYLAQLAQTGATERLHNIFGKILGPSCWASRKTA